MAKQKFIDIGRAEELASQGFTQRQIANSLGISERTLYNRKKESKELSKAIKKGIATKTKRATQTFIKSKLNRKKEPWHSLIETSKNWMIEEPLVNPTLSEEVDRYLTNMRGITDKELDELLRPVDKEIEEFLKNFDSQLK